MKIMKPVCLSLLVFAGTLLGTRGADFRTDINPALIYYRAFLLQPDFSSADSDYLFTNVWQNQRLPERFGHLVEGYNQEFKLIHQAAQSTVPCDWGIDMSAGPETLLPQLARAKGVALAARLRVQWELQNGEQDKALDDLLATFALARNLPRDGTLISTLVQFAMEAIESSTIAANFGQLSPETLQQLADGLDALPAGRTVAESVGTEKMLFLDRTRRKVLELQRQNPGNDAKVMAGVHQLMGFHDQVEEQRNLWQRITTAADGTSDGILRLLNEREQTYDTLTNFLKLPYSEFKSQAHSFTESAENSPNPFIAESVPSFVKARVKEFRIQATLAMVRAAIEYKLHGESGLNSIADPCGNGPFAFQRFVFQGVDRGFELKSAFNVDHNLAVLIFVEKEGPPFQVDANYPGRPLPQTVPQN